MFFHGTRSALTQGDLLAPAGTADAHVLLTTKLDEAIWSAELAEGEGAPRVYVVEALGDVASVDRKSVG